MRETLELPDPDPDADPIPAPDDPLALILPPKMSRLLRVDTVLEPDA
jgi:hypothetical protein